MADRLNEAAHNRKDYFMALGAWLGCMLVETTNKILVNITRPSLGEKTSTVDTPVYLTVVSEEPVDAP